MSANICRDFLKGKCRFGNRCKYSHGDVDGGKGKSTSKGDYSNGNRKVQSKKEEEIGKIEDYISFLSRSLSSPTLTGKRSEMMIWRPLLLSKLYATPRLKLNLFFSGEMSLKHRISRKRFVQTLLENLTYDDLSAERTIQLIAKESMKFYEIVQELLSECNSDSEFNATFIPLIFSFTSSYLMTPLALCREANTIFGIVNELFDQFLRIFCTHFEDSFQSFVGTTLVCQHQGFFPCAITHYLLPFLELVFHIVNAYQNPKFSKILKQFIYKCETWVSAWEHKINQGGQSQFESIYNVILVKRILEKIAVVCEIALEHLIKADTATSTRACVPPIDPWIWGVLKRPGNRHSNDHDSIKDITVDYMVDEMLYQGDSALPGNHQLSKQAHWLNFGPERLLDTHFRLLREDSIRACRIGIQSLIDEQKKSSNNHNANNEKFKAPFKFDYNLTVYPSTRMIRLCYSKNDGIFFQVALPSFRKGARKGDSELDAGYLTAFIADSQQRDIIFAKVLRCDRLVADVQPLGEHGTEQFLKLQNTGTFFLIYLSNVLLNSIHPILEALKSTDPATLPFTKYICPTEPFSSRVKKIDPPIYSRVPGFSFDLSFLVKAAGINNLRLDTSNPASIHNTLELLRQHSTLDPGQCNALISALSREYACIQGPPGTGKSYLGVKIVQSIVSSQLDLGPILVICHTNHALDQFLEHLLDVNIENIVRIGSRTASERIKPLILRNSDTNRDLFRTREGQCYRKLEGELNDKFEFIKNHLRNGSWSETSKILDDFFPGFKDVLQAFFDEEKREGYLIVRKGKKKYADDPFELWLETTSSVTSKRNIEELLYCKDHPFEEISNDEKDAIVSFIKTILQGLFADEMCEFNEKYKLEKMELDAIYDARRVEFLKNLNIIGITTTGVALNRNWIKNLDPKVIICEEAGEILEAHTLSFLNPGLSHLVMIGDHLQLRPQANEYGLCVESREGKKFSLNVSQFERMQLTGYGYPLETLNIQRRMRPEISQLISETIYPSLLNHPNVEEYPDVLGCFKNVFFLDHRNCEDRLKKTGKGDSAWEGSHSNSWEATFAVALTKYFINQGFAPNEITILTPYLGQLVKIRAALSDIRLHVLINEKDDLILKQREQFFDVEEDIEDKVTSDRDYMMAEKNLKDCIRVSTVDNYQGEENRIIIASLVRNCGDKLDVMDAKIGFLSVENRTNVLLSRAKEGLYMLGHAELLSLKSQIWAKTLAILEKNDSAGTELPLYCQLHPDYRQSVKDAIDIKIKFPDGGCTLQCQYRLKCGHKCPRLCHPDDPKHISVFCPADCLRVRDTCGHSCTKRCGDKCGNCLVVVAKSYKFDTCGHLYLNPKCHELASLESNTKKCMEKVRKKLPCDHEAILLCHEDPEDKDCKEKCNETLVACGHPCSNFCHKIDDPDAHATSCSVKCDEILLCGHYCGSECHKGSDCPECKAKCEMMKCSHSKCNHPCNENCNPCVEPCAVSCKHVEPCPLPCGAPCLCVPCDQRCPKLLECGHQCPSVCGEICPTVKYCQGCSKNKDILSTVVDLISFQEYKDIDLNETPIIVLECGHLKTIDTLDGMVSLERFFCKDKNGKWIADKFPDIGYELVALPVCPDCRKSITNVKRYSRIIRSAQIDQSEKRHLISMHRAISAVKNAMTRAESEQKPFFERKAQECIKQCLNMMKSPSEKLWQSCLSQLKSKHLDAQFLPYLHVPKPQNVVKAKFYVLVSQFNGFLSDKKKLQEINRRKTINSNYELAKQGRKFALLGNNENLENELYLEELRWTLRLLQFFSKTENNRDALKSLKIEKMEDLKIAMKTKMEDLKTNLNNLSKRAVLSFKESSSWNTVLKMQNVIDDYLKLGVFDEIQYEEAAMVYKALLDANEFSGTGHAYRCSSNHLYFIGECGMAMQESSCPECGETIGGSNHALNGTNSHARDFEVIFQKMSAVKGKKKNKKLKSIPSFPFLLSSNQLEIQRQSHLEKRKCVSLSTLVSSLLLPISSFSTFLLSNSVLMNLMNKKEERPAVAMLRYERNPNSNTSSSNPNTKLESISLSNHVTILEFYWNGCYGKSTLSRGLPSWFKRHFFKSEYTPKGLVELKKHENFTPDLVDWYSKEWEKYQKLADGLDEVENMKVKETYLGQEEYLLSPEEAFFLLFAIDVLEIRDERNLRPLSAQECWTLFRENSLSKYTNRFDFNPESTPASVLTNDFAVQYAVYHHFRSKGWTPRSGLNLGFDILLYKKGPQYSHAEFCVWVVPKHYKIDNWKLIGKVRVASNVKKRVILCFVEIPQDLSSYQCLDQFVIHEVKIGRWVPDKSIDQTPKLKN